MMTHAQKSRLMSLLRDPENDDLLDIVRGLDTFKPERVKTPRQRVNNIHKMRNVKPDEWVEAKLLEIMAEADEPQRTPDTVIDVVCSVHGITSETVKRHDRKREVSDARHMTIGLMESHCLYYSMSYISLLCNRNPTTVLKSARMFHTLTDTDPAFRAKREKCEAMLRERE
jgi:chromosomal replication initiation ATPase DnaA